MRVAGPSPARFMGRLRPSRLRRGVGSCVRGILPAWFATTMGTGIASVLLHQLPYQFRGQKTIANVIFGCNVVLFLTLFSLMIARCILYPGFLRPMLLHPTQPMFVGTIPQGFATLITMMVDSLLPAYAAHTPARTAILDLIEVFWWLNAVTSLSIAVGAVFLQVRRHSSSASLSKLGPFLLLSIAAPVISAATGSTVAGALASASSSSSPPDELALRARHIALASYVLLGTSLPPCLGFMAIHFLRTAMHGLPDQYAIISMFLPLGPCGQAGLALVQLSNVVESVGLSVAIDGSSTCPDRSADADPALACAAKLIAPAIKGGSIVLTLLLWGLGLFWLAIATACVLETHRTSGLAFNIGYWGCTFPIGAFTTSTLALGSANTNSGVGSDAGGSPKGGGELDSRAFRILGTALAVSVVLLWATMSVLTLHTLVWKGGRGIYGPPPPTSLSPARPARSEDRANVSILKHSAGRNEEEASAEKDCGVEKVGSLRPRESMPPRAPRTKALGDRGGKVG